MLDSRLHQQNLQQKQSESKILQLLLHHQPDHQKERRKKDTKKRRWKSRTRGLNPRSLVVILE